MALNSNDSANGYKDCIANNIPSRAFRYATESKNVLSAAGAMYVGTGIKRNTIMLLDAPVWVSGTAYDAGYIVTYSGRNYKANKAISSSDATPDTDTENWDDISVGYDSYITAVLNTPSSEGYTLQVKNKTIGEIDGQPVTGYFPCWVKGDSDNDIIVPEIVG